MIAVPGSCKTNILRAKMTSHRKSRLFFGFRGSAAVIAASVLFGATAAANASGYTVTLEEVGSDVVAMGSGAIDVRGLSVVTNAGELTSQMYPAGSIIATGFWEGTGFANSDEYYASVSGPFSFGSGITVTTSSGSGDLVGMIYQAPFFSVIAVPLGYVSDTALSDSATYSSATFASLGVTPGTYTWTWGTGADQSFTLNVGTTVTPLPAALPLFAGGLGALGLLGWRRNRKTAPTVADLRLSAD